MYKRTCQSVSGVSLSRTSTSTTTTTSSTSAATTMKGRVVALLVALTLASSTLALPDAIPEAVAEADPVALPDADPDAEPHADAEPDAEPKAKSSPSPLSDPEGRLEPEKPIVNTKIDSDSSQFFGYEPSTNTEPVIAPLARAHKPPSPKPTRQGPFRIRKRLGLAREQSRERIRARNRRRNNGDASRVEVIKRLPVTFGKRVTLRDSIDDAAILRPQPSPIQPEGPEELGIKPVFQPLTQGLFKPTPSPLALKSSSPFPLTPSPLAFEDTSPSPPGNLHVTRLRPILARRNLQTPKPSVFNAPSFGSDAFENRGLGPFNGPRFTTSRPFGSDGHSVFNAPRVTTSRPFGSDGHSVFNAPRVTTSRPFGDDGHNVFNGQRDTTSRPFIDDGHSVFNGPRITTSRPFGDEGQSAFNDPIFTTSRPFIDEGQSAFNGPRVTTSRPFIDDDQSIFINQGFTNFGNEGQSVFNTPRVTPSRPFIDDDQSIFINQGFTNSFNHPGTSVFNDPRFTNTFEDTRSDPFNTFPSFTTKSSGQSHTFPPSSLDFSSPDPHQSFPQLNPHFQNEVQRFPDRHATQIFPSDPHNSQRQPSIFSLSPTHRFSFSPHDAHRDIPHPPQANSVFSSVPKDQFQPRPFGHSTFNTAIHRPIRLPVHQSVQSTVRPPVHSTVHPHFQSTTHPPFQSTVHEAFLPTIPPPVHSTPQPVIKSTVQEEVHPVITTTVSPLAHAVHSSHSVTPAPPLLPGLPKSIVQPARVPGSYILPDAHYKPTPQKVQTASPPPPPPRPLPVRRRRPTVTRHQPPLPPTILTSPPIPTVPVTAPEVPHGIGRYDLDWAVRDDHYGTHFNQQETRREGVTRGSYSVLLPDGRLQTVNYYVDSKSGYVAEVTYSNPGDKGYGGGVN
ncbi:uncharacterized protein LOC127004807 isoform X2 [Eriocheir sinensis]|uniref:uncharacterized protein LOC127004807 isoform X2 n=1 Tax=Eriocheir sinensis TaxID=95602 RepID=UPI0021CA9A79|nr:uncharacterized protein LOC127004807 isoform X2 [Eriocheir sinensis]